MKKESNCSYKTKRNLEEKNKELGFEPPARWIPARRGEPLGQIIFLDLFHHKCYKRHLCEEKKTETGAHTRAEQKRKMTSPQCT